MSIRFFAMVFLGVSTVCAAGDSPTQSKATMLHGFRSEALEIVKDRALAVDATVDLQFQNDDGKFETVRSSIAIASIERTSGDAIAAVFLRLTPDEKKRISDDRAIARLWIEAEKAPRMSKKPNAGSINPNLPGARLRNAIQHADDLVANEHIEVLPNYAIANERDDTVLWSMVHEAFANSPYDGSRVAVFRVFLEEERSQDKITILPRQGQAYFPSSAGIPNHHGTMGAHEDRLNSQFVGVLRDGKKSTTTIVIKSPRHLPVERNFDWSDGPEIRCHDLMLRKPSKAKRGRMVVTLTDDNGDSMTDWRFMYGPVTFGGPYGESANLNENGEYVADHLAAQSFQIGFDKRMHAKWRTTVDVKPGRTTRVAYKLDESDVLQKPVVTYE